MAYISEALLYCKRNLRSNVRMPADSLATGLSSWLCEMRQICIAGRPIMLHLEAYNSFSDIPMFPKHACFPHKKGIQKIFCEKKDRCITMTIGTLNTLCKYLAIFKQAIHMFKAVHLIEFYVEGV